MRSNILEKNQNGHGKSINERKIGKNSGLLIFQSLRTSRSLNPRDVM
jgi:hypothetical protein